MLPRISPSALDRRVDESFTGLANRLAPRPGSPPVGRDCCRPSLGSSMLAPRRILLEQPDSVVANHATLTLNLQMGIGGLDALAQTPAFTNNPTGALQLDWCQERLS